MRVGLARHRARRLDLDVEFERGARVVGVRVVILPGRDQAMTRVCPNLPRTPFSMDLVARLHRFGWQIERCFKEWKSYATLHQFDTANPHIAEGLIWASLCAAVLKRFLAHAAQHLGDGVAISTRRVAMCACHTLDALVMALLQGVGPLAALRRGLAYLLANARRATRLPPGRLRSWPAPIQTAVFRPMHESETGAFAPRPLALPLRLLLIAVGTLSLLVGLVAVVVPGLPTTEFVILAAACYVRSSERLYRWLTSRPWLRPQLAAARRYAHTRALPLRIKAVAIGTAWLSLALLAAGTVPAPPWAVWAVLVAAVTCTVSMLRIGTVRD